MRRTTAGQRERLGFFIGATLLIGVSVGVSPANARADAASAPLPSSFACPATIAGETLLKDSSLRNDSEVAAAGIYMPAGFRQLDCTYAIPNDANQGIKFNVQYFAQGDPNIGNDGICEKSYSAGGPVNGDTSLYFNSFLAGFDTYGSYYSTTKIAWTSFTLPGDAPSVVDPVEQLTREWFLESLALAGDCPGVASQPGTPNPAQSPFATSGAGEPAVLTSGTDGPTPGELAIACAIILMLIGGGAGVGVHRHGVRKRRFEGAPPPPPTASVSVPPPPPAPDSGTRNYVAGEFITDFIKDEVSMGTYTPPTDHFANLGTSVSPPPPDAPGLAERIGTDAVIHDMGVGLYGHSAPTGDHFTLGGPPPPPPPPVVPLDFSPQMVQGMLSQFVGPDHTLRVPSIAPAIAQLLNGFTMSDPVYASGSVSVALTDPLGLTETQVHLQMQAQAGKAVVTISSDGPLPLSQNKARDYLQRLIDQRLSGQQVVGTTIDPTGIHLSLAR